jgi:hypothetical protein
MSPAEEFIQTAEEIRFSRGVLLDSVNASYPAWLEEGIIVRGLCSQDSALLPIHVQRDLAYLLSRGLIEKLEQPNPSGGPDAAGRRPMVTRWRLTADGITFVERGKPWVAMERIGK